MQVHEKGFGLGEHRDVDHGQADRTAYKILLYKLLL